MPQAIRIHITKPLLSQFEPMRKRESNNGKQNGKNAKRESRRRLLKSAIVTTMSVNLAGQAFADDKVKSSKLPVVNSGGAKPIQDRLRSSDTPLKQRARKDYAKSLGAHGGKLSTPIRQLFVTAKDDCEIHFGVVVIGSGYGASICAARLSSRLKDEHRICMIERGKEWVPGTFPDSTKEVFGNTRNMLAGPQKGQLNNPLGLYNVMMNEEVNVLTGNGLGGGSLINASIALRPHHEVFKQKDWPRALRDVSVLGPYYKRVAKQMSLTVTPFDQTPKVRARRKAAERVSNEKGFYDRSNVSVMYDFRHLDDQVRNPQGMIQRPCTLCGDCITGCNVGSKNTLMMNYLPIAKHNGTEMYTQCEVESIEKKNGYYRLNLVYIKEAPKSGEISRHPVSINSKMVVVGAGSPGSAMVLMNSQKDNFNFSPALGYNWSGNGDTIGFVIDMPGPTNIGGYGAYDTPNCRTGVGPTVQSSLNYYSNQDLHRRLLIQDAAIPRGVSNLFTVLLGDKSLDNSMVMLGMGHDGANGRVIQKNGRFQIKWPGLRDGKYRQMVFGEFERLAAAHGGKYKRLKAFGYNLVTVHPLGGCGMSDDPAFGTTNHLGQVYDGRCETDMNGEAAVHHGLYVADGSVIPTALGVNPYMSIGAISERIAGHIVTNPAHADLFEQQAG